MVTWFVKALRKSQNTRVISSETMPLAPDLQNTRRPRVTRRPPVSECRDETTCLRLNVLTGHQVSPIRHDRKQDTPSGTAANTSTNLSQPETCDKQTQPKSHCCTRLRSDNNNATCTWQAAYLTAHGVSVRIADLQSCLVATVRHDWWWTGKNWRKNTTYYFFDQQSGRSIEHIFSRNSLTGNSDSLVNHGRCKHTQTLSRVWLKEVNQLQHALFSVSP